MHNDEIEKIDFVLSGFQGCIVFSSKALHSELLTELSSQFLSRNEFFTISEVRV